MRRTLDVRIEAAMRAYASFHSAAFESPDRNYCLARAEDCLAKAKSLAEMKDRIEEERIR
jgi:hypothetical protein